MASKTEIALRIVDLVISEIVPYVRGLIERRKSLQRMRDEGQEPTEADWAASDEDHRAAVDELRSLLLPEAEPEAETRAPVDDSG